MRSASNRSGARRPSGRPDDHQFAAPDHARIGLKLGAQRVKRARLCDIERRAQPGFGLGQLGGFVKVECGGGRGLERCAPGEQVIRADAVIATRIGSGGDLERLPRQVRFVVRLVQAPDPQVRSGLVLAGADLGQPPE
jgi:hypothetical protein